MAPDVAPVVAPEVAPGVAPEVALQGRPSWSTVVQRCESSRPRGGVERTLPILLLIIINNNYLRIFNVFAFCKMRHKKW